MARTFAAQAPLPFWFVRQVEIAVLGIIFAVVVDDSTADDSNSSGSVGIWVSNALWFSTFAYLLNAALPYDTADILHPGLDRLMTDNPLWDVIKKKATQCCSAEVVEQQLVGAEQRMVPKPDLRASMRTSMRRGPAPDFRQPPQPEARVAPELYVPERSTRPAPVLAGFVPPPSVDPRRSAITPPRRPAPSLTLLPPPTSTAARMSLPQPGSSSMI